MFCVNCGKSLNNDFKFCPYCGTNISTGVLSGAHDNDFEIVAGTLVKYKGSSPDVVIPNNVVQIGDKAFYNMSALKSVIIPSSVKTIGTDAFMLCYSLSSVTFSSGINIISNDAFRDCHSLKSIILPDSINSIYSGAFSGCTSLTKIKLPSKLQSLSPRTFAGCISLKEIEIPNSVLKIELERDFNSGGVWYNDCKSSCFYGCKNLRKITYPTRFSPENFYDTPVYEEWREKELREHRIANGRCPECGEKLSIFGKCKNRCH